jgi:hypothetical protein
MEDCMNMFPGNTVAGAIAIAAAVLATTAAFAENANGDQRKELAKLWGEDTSAVSAPAWTRAVTTTNIRPIGSYGRVGSGGIWADNFRGGRVHEPAGH